MKKSLAFRCALFISIGGYSQLTTDAPLWAVLNNNSYPNQLLVYWENDMFLRTDYYFTNGAAFELFSENLQWNTLNKLLYTPFTLSETRNSITIRQNMYTPRKTNSTDVQLEDRPYSGFLILEYKLSSRSTKRKFVSSLSVGVIGKNSLAAITQNLVHSMDHLNTVMGWNYQINDAPVINLNYENKNKLIRSTYFDLQYGVRGRLGTLYTDASANVGFRAGILNDGFDYSANINRNSKVVAYVFIKAGVKLSYYDATLQGSIWGYKPNEHYFNNSQRYLVGSNVQGGVVLSYRFVKLRASVTRITPEYKGGLPHGWGEVSIGISF